MTSTDIRTKRKQWAWFVGLWCAGFATVFTLSLVIKFVMNIGG